MICICVSQDVKLAFANILTHFNFSEPPSGEKTHDFFKIFL